MQNTLIRATRIIGPRKLVRQLPLRVRLVVSIFLCKMEQPCAIHANRSYEPLAFSLIPLNLLMSTAFSRMRLTYLIDIYTKISI
jgi:hypothetical protein